MDYIEETFTLHYTYHTYPPEKWKKNRELQKNFYQDAAAAILICDYSDPQSLTDLKGWKYELIRQTPRHTPKILIGIKAEDEYMSHQMVQETAKDLKLKHYETSIPNPKLFDKLNQMFIKQIVNPPESNYMFKVCIVGNKTKLNQEFGNLTTDSKFNPDHMVTLGMDIPTKLIRVNNQVIKLIILVLAGESFFKKLRSSHYRGAAGVIILFDKSNLSSLEDVNKWHQEASKVLSVASLPLAVVGIKTGEEKITSESGQRVAEELQGDYFETSLKDTKQVSSILKEMGKKILQEFLKSPR